MEIFLSLVAIWQLLELLELQDKGIINNKRYVILCLSLLVVPFFSYTYPIAIAPVFAILLIRSIWANGEIKFKHSGFRQLARLWLPMVICSLSILVFYIIDVSQLMADRNMNEYWSYRMAKGNFRLLPILEKLWRLFAEVGAGFVFELIFGALGVCAFIYAVRAYVLNYQALRHDKAAMLRLYAIILLVIVIGLFLAGKLPVGEPKFNAFTVPSISILILFLLNDLLLKKNTIRFSGILTLVLFLGLTGNILSTFINNFTAPEYKKRMDIFVSTEQAILLARTSRIPIFTTSQVAFPDSININTPHLITITPDCVLKTFPAYNVNDKILVYAIRDLAQIEDCFRLLPPEVKTALAGDGLTFRLVKRK